MVDVLDVLDVSTGSLLLLMGFVQVKNALKLSHTKDQWVDLGIQTDACLVLPETCGPEGAAVVLWVKIHLCSGIISSFGDTTGFMIYCLPGNGLV